MTPQNDPEQQAAMARPWGATPVPNSIHGLSLEEGSDLPSKKSKVPWVRYRTDLRHRDSKKLLTRMFSDSPRSLQGENQGDEPTFDLVTTYYTAVQTPQPDLGLQATILLETPAYQLNIYSPAIINALRSVVEYYPTQDLTTEVLEIQWPYAILAHHYDELSAYRNGHKDKSPETLCRRKRNTVEDIALLLKFLDENVMKEVRAEHERNRRGVYTWEHAWVLHKPGATMLVKSREETDFAIRVVRSIERGPHAWVLRSWSLDYDGIHLGRTETVSTVPRFGGEGEMGKIFFINENAEEDEIKSLDEELEHHLEEGKLFWSLMHKQCQYYKGESAQFPFNEMDGLVMSDLKTYYEQEPKKAPDLLGHDDLRNWASTCDCLACRSQNSELGAKDGAMFDEYQKLTIEVNPTLTPHQYLVCPRVIKAYVFRTRRWESLHIRHFRKPQWDQDLMNSLVMDEDKKKTLKALSKSYARLNKQDERLEQDLWSADFVKGKGAGLVFLLHGRPGVGKTCTAECIAQFTKRPLMVITPSDIGTELGFVEWILARHFRTAKSWGAVLLIDEADVFMEQRTTTDLARNGLVAGFLRALESYDGILFLTTNRRKQVWKTFMDKLSKERGSTMRLNIDAKEYIASKAVAELKWNGREIRNAFQTAVALAEYDNEKDEEGRVLITDSHFKAVTELSRDFKSYLHELKKGDESKRAERRMERLDTYGVPVKGN